MSAIETGIGLINSLAVAVKKMGIGFSLGDGKSSYVDFAKLSRVEPTVIVSPDCMNLDYMPQINQSILSIFMAYYLQAVDMMATISNASTVRALEMLNPNRSGMGTLLTFESRKPCYDYSLLKPTFVSMRMEAYKDNPALTDEQNEIQRQRKKADDNLMGVHGTNAALGDGKISLQENVNLSIGRLMDVTIETVDKDGDPVKRTVKMGFRLMVSSLPENIIGALLSNGTAERSFMERFHAWRSTRLSFIRDLIMCQDLIDEKYKMAVQDKSGKAAEMFERISKNKVFSNLSFTPSLGSSSNIYVISEEVAQGIEAKAGGKLTDYRVRQKLFEQSYAMIIVVVNRETSRMKFFVRGQPDYTNLSRKEIEGHSKGGKGPDVMEIFRSLQTASFSNF